MSTSDVKIKLMTYNVWSNEHVAVYRRMQSISDLIARHDPDVIFLQEVTSYTNRILQRTPWWRQYRAFTPPRNMGQNCFCVLLSKLHAGYGDDYILPRLIYERSRRPVDLLDLLSTRLDWNRKYTDADANNGVEGGVYYICVYYIWTDQRLHVGTCCLPGPTQSDARSMGRIEMAEEFLNYLDKCYDGNFVLAGDMNWDEDLDGPFPIEGLTGRVVDAWRELRGDGGWTYDVVANPMLRGRNPERKRPDRFLCKLRDFELHSIEMVGTEAIPGLTYYGAEGNALPVLPSHRFGLVLTISRKDDRSMADVQDGLSLPFCFSCKE